MCFRYCVKDIIVLFGIVESLIYWKRLLVNQWFYIVGVFSLCLTTRWFAKQSQLDALRIENASLLILAKNETQHV